MADEKQTGPTAYQYQQFLQDPQTTGTPIWLSEYYSDADKIAAAQAEYNAKGGQWYHDPDLVKFVASSGAEMPTMQKDPNNPNAPAQLTMPNGTAYSPPKGETYLDNLMSQAYKAAPINPTKIDTTGMSAADMLAKAPPTGTPEEESYWAGVFQNKGASDTMLSFMQDQSAQGELAGFNGNEGANTADDASNAAIHALRYSGLANEQINKAVSAANTTAQQQWQEQHKKGTAGVF